MKKIMAMVAFGWGVILLALFAYTDLTMPAVNQNSDYLMTFYTAGHLVHQGQLNSLYPPKASSTFVDSDFDKAAHAVLPQLPTRATAEYMYMPAVAAFFMPLSLLPPSYSLLAWQLISLTALAICTVLFSKRFNNNLSGLNAAAFWSALTLIPLAISIWIGQVSVVFGVLPLMVGTDLLMRKKQLAAGLLLSLTVVKPQFFLPSMLLSVGLAATKQFRVLTSIVFGAAAIMLLNYIAFSGSLFEQWLSTLKLADTVYSDLKSGVAQHIATSLPRAIILLCPIEQHAIVKPVVYALSAVLAGIGLFYLVKILRSNLSVEVKIGLAMLICVFATPMVVPHVFFYDYAIFVVAGYIAYAVDWPEKISYRIRSLIWLGWLLTNIYGVIVLTNKNFAIPIIFVVLMLELYRRTISIARDALRAD